MRPDDPRIDMYASPYVTERSASVIQIESNKLMPWLFLVCMLSGVSIGLSALAVNLANKAERESRLQRLETDEMKVALSIHGISTHQDGDSP